MANDWQNKLYFGDNLDILREYVAEQSVDLIYLDPPFNSKATYNVLFHEKNGTDSPAQIAAFDDTWHWDLSSEAAYREVVTGGGKIGTLLTALRQFLGANDMMAYLTMMAIRLIELHRVLKPTGSIYLHCDPTASHYLKLLMDAVFGAAQFRNEITWKRKTGRGETDRRAKRFGVSTDSIFYYAKPDAAGPTPQYTFDDPAYQRYIEKAFRHVDADGRRYQIDNLASPSPRPNLMYEYKGYKPPEKGWAISREKMEQWDREGRLHFPKSPKGRIRRKRFLDELKGKPVQNLWDDIGPIASQAKERLGYPTQKPEALLERIIQASSNEGDLVLDPFCGCGTTLAVAERLHRRWIGIDITHLAITLMRHRLEDTFGAELSPYEVIGDPQDLPGAIALFEQDPYQFEWWALGLVEARPAGGQKKGADKGVDGYIYFFDDDSGQAKKIVVQVKGGGVGSPQVQQLKGAMEREEAQIGAFITLQQPTGPMKREAAEAGFYDPPGLLPPVPRLQILTIEELLSGRKLDYPKVAVATFKKAPRQTKSKRQTSTPE